MFSAKDLGVDIEVVSSTKYISGGATSLGGLIIDYGTEYTKGFTPTIKSELLFNFGAYMTPQAAFLQTMGLETLDARYRVQSANALTLAKKLQTLKPVKFVNYVGLEDNKFYALAQKQFGKTAGAMVCIDLESRGGLFQLPQPSEARAPRHESLRQPHACHPSLFHDLRQLLSGGESPGWMCSTPPSV